MKGIFTRIISAVVSVSILISLAACGQKTATNAPQAKAQETAKQDSSKPVEVSFWHSMGGTGGEGIDKMVQDFNSSNKKNIKVTATFQGSYDDALNKMKAAAQSNSGPNIMQLYDIGTHFMIDSKWTVPVQNYIDSEKFDVSKLEPNILGYYTVDNKLHSMPFNSSTPILYYNKNAFKDAGLDPEKPPKNFKEIEEYSKKLLKKDSNGNVTQYGYSMAIYGWFFEQFQAKTGSLFVNNGNGRDARGTEVVYVTDQNVKLLEWWKKWWTASWRVISAEPQPIRKRHLLQGKLPLSWNQRQHLQV